MLLSKPRSTSLMLLCELTGPAFAEGFLDDAKTGLLLRNFYLSNDYRSPSPTGKNYKQEWAQGFIGTFESGFTPDSIGSHRANSAQAGDDIDRIYVVIQYPLNF